MEGVPPRVSPGLDRGLKADASEELERVSVAFA
jgi:hypothetical protein